MDVRGEVGSGCERKEGGGCERGFWRIRHGLEGKLLVEYLCGQRGTVGLRKLLRWIHSRAIDQFCWAWAGKDR